MNCDEKTDSKEKLNKLLEKTLMPSIQTFQYVLQNYAREAEQELRLNLNFEVSVCEDSTPVQKVVVLCPNEFGSVCEQIETFFTAFGGSCRREPGNTVCELPDRN